MLAEGDSFPVQAFSYGGTAYALQFHMDVTHATMCRWTTRGHERMALPNAKPRDAHFEGRLMHDAGLPGLAGRVHRPLAPVRRDAGAKSAPHRTAYADVENAQRRVSKVSTR